MVVNQSISVNSKNTSTSVHISINCSKTSIYCKEFSLRKRKKADAQAMHLVPSYLQFLLSRSLCSINHSCRSRSRHNQSERCLSKRAASRYPLARIDSWCRLTKLDQRLGGATAPRRQQRDARMSALSFPKIFVYLVGLYHFVVEPTGPDRIPQCKALPCNDSGACHTAVQLPFSLRVTLIMKLIFGVRIHLSVVRGVYIPTEKERLAAE